MIFLSFSCISINRALIICISPSIASCNSADKSDISRKRSIFDMSQRIQMTRKPINTKQSMSIIPFL